MPQTKIFLLLGITLPAVSWGYVDPGSGYMLWQLALAVLFGTLFHVARVGNWLKRLVRRSPQKQTEPPMPEKTTPHN